MNVYYCIIKSSYMLLQPGFNQIENPEDRFSHDKAPVVNASNGRKQSVNALDKHR